MEATLTPFWHLVVLALIQGVTEFLPISSSAHLILAPLVTGWEDQGLMLDVAMHIGTLAAVVLYFRRDVAELCAGALEAVRGVRTPRSRLAVQIVVATVPVVVAGFLLKTTIATDWRNPVLIAATTAIFGIALWLADRRAGVAQAAIANLTWRDAVLIGLAQAIALVPGVSRSGITMTAALMLGLGRTEAARLSLLLSIPTTAGAGVLATVDVVQSGNAALQTDAAVAGVLAFVSALGAIWALMAWLRRSSFMPFVVYRLLLAAVLAVLLLGGWLPAAA